VGGLRRGLPETQRVVEEAGLGGGRRIRRRGEEIAVGVGAAPVEKVGRRAESRRKGTEKGGGGVSMMSGPECVSRRKRARQL
jgi:hypothetical protein